MPSEWTLEPGDLSGDATAADQFNESSVWHNSVQGDDAVYLATWTEAKMKTETLRRLRELCDDPVKVDIMTMFSTHVVYYFDETTLPSDPRESDWMEIKMGIMQGKIIPLDLTRL